MKLRIKWPKKKGSNFPCTVHTGGGTEALRGVAARGTDGVLTELSPPPLPAHHLTTGAAVVLPMVLQ